MTSPLPIPRGQIQLTPNGKNSAAVFLRTVLESNRFDQRNTRHVQVDRNGIFEFGADRILDLALQSAAEVDLGFRGAWAGLSRHRKKRTETLLDR
jgi:hypothetical protein